MITTQKDFFAEVSKKSGVTQKAVKEVYDAMIETILQSATTETDTKTIIPEIGTLVVAYKESYVGKNPKTGDPINVPESRRARIKIAPKFVEKFKIEAESKKTKTVKASAKKVSKKTIKK